MTWDVIDVATPDGDSKKKFGDDYIRELKTQVVNCLKEISHYPTTSTPRTAVWTTSTRPTSGLVDRLSGFNDTLGVREYYDLATATWKPEIKDSVLQALIDAILPVGIIVDWSGAVANIPARWSLCDGTNGTPDLTDKFVVGAGGDYEVGATGGSEEVTLTPTLLPDHYHHSSAAPSDGTKAGSTLIHEKGDGEDHFALYCAGSGCAGDAGDTGYMSGPQSPGFRTGSMTTGGSATPIDIRPKFYALAKIMRTG
jgi:hypothetical protein